jgi:hypothetical protein
MKIELKQVLFIFVGAFGILGLLNAPFIIQALMLPFIGGVFGNWIYQMNEAQRGELK